MGRTLECGAVARFQGFELDSRSGELRFQGERVPLQEKPLRILQRLVDCPGDVVTRDELRQALWSADTFVDFDGGLNTAVNKLRQALGDSADQPRYIETVPGRGYRFIAPLERASVKAVLEMAPPSALRIEPKPLERQRPWVLIVVGALIVIGGGFWLATRRPEPAAMAKPARFAVVPPAGFVLEAGVSRQSFALSPDGTHLAFTAMDRSGAFSAFVRAFTSPGRVKRSGV